jgi:signal transduction histidine kinase
LKKEPVAESESQPYASVLRAQREANERLVLAALRATEEAVDAEGARLRAEQESSALRQTADELRATAEFRERLIGIIGHDLRDPLNTIIIAGELLARQGTPAAGADAKLATKIVASGQRMARMIEDLVDFTRARLGGGFNLRIAATDLTHICAAIVGEFRICSPTEILHTSAGHVSGSWDADRLAQVISNLLGNAVEHATPGTAVLVHSYRDGEFAIAEVTNRGPTIPAATIAMIFKAFRRAASTESKGHLGLGLFIASEIVRAHGGTLSVRSCDEATTFTVCLPCPSR